MPKASKNSPYDPLGHCPEGERSRYRKRAVRATGGSRVAAMELACIHCMGFQPTLVKDCSDPSCPLWKWAVKSK